MILVDTSVWVDYFRNEETPEVDYLVKSIQDDDNICLCGLILTEILQGLTSDKEYKQVSKLLKALLLLPLSDESYYLAANIYRKARHHGKIIRNSIDCLIAACAIDHNVRLLQKDRDYLTIERYSSLRLVRI